MNHLGLLRDGGIVLFLLITLEIEPEVSPTPGKHLTTELYPTFSTFKNF